MLDPVNGSPRHGHDPSGSIPNGTPARLFARCRDPSTSWPVATETGPPVQQVGSWRRRRETSAAFSLSTPWFAWVAARGRVSAARVVITSRGAREHLGPPVGAKVSLSLCETPAGVMMGSAPLQRDRPGRLGRDSARDAVRAVGLTQQHGLP